MDDARIKDEGIKPKPEPGLDEGSIMASIMPVDSVDNAQTEDKQMVPETNYMDQLVSKTSADELEAGVALGLQLLDSLKAPLNSVLAVTNTTKAATWLEAIQHLQDAAKPSRTVVGVVYVALPYPMACSQVLY